MSYPKFKKELERLKEDNIHGASHLYRQLLKIFVKANDDLDRAEYRKLVKELKNWRPLMGNVLNGIAIIEEYAEKSANDIATTLAKSQAEMEDAQKRTIFNAAKIIKRHRRIATISYSGQVGDSLLRAAREGWQGNILIAESRPMMEGRLLAKRLVYTLSDSRIVFGTDCQVLSLVPKVDAVFIGADLISLSFFINKMGTLSMCCAVSPGKKIYVIADSTKYYAPHNMDIHFSVRPTSEIWPHHPSKIDILNNYFEIIKFQPRIKFINEFGVWTGDRVKNYLENSQALL